MFDVLSKILCGRKKYPMMFHLHGAGSRGTDFKEFEGSAILNILEKEDSLYLMDFVSEYGNEDEKTIAKLIRKLCMKFKISEYM